MLLFFVFYRAEIAIFFWLALCEEIGIKENGVDLFVGKEIPKMTATVQAKKMKRNKKSMMFSRYLQ